MSRTWHNNYKIEHSLPLTEYGPPRDDTSAAASEEKGGEGQKAKLPRVRAKPKAKTAEQTAAAEMSVIASTHRKTRKAIELVQTAAAALLVAAAGELMPIDKVIHEKLNHLLGELQTADAVDQQFA
eukprot:12084490-Heterocapsa_arctica.AAC.1